MITPADIENKEFSRAKKGYNEEEVDEFLDLIILDMEKLIRENKQLKNELSKAHVQVDKHMSTETSVYETLESARSLMNDIAASAERRADILLKNAELEANLITREARESISKYTDEGNRLKGRVETLKERYKKMLEAELERLDFGSTDFLADFENDFVPASMAATDGVTHVANPTDDSLNNLEPKAKNITEEADVSPSEKQTKTDNQTVEETDKAQDLTRTMVHVR